MKPSRMTPVVFAADHGGSFKPGEDVFGPDWAKEECMAAIYPAMLNQQTGTLYVKPSPVVALWVYVLRSVLDAVMARFRRRQSIENYPLLWRVPTRNGDHPVDTDDLVVVSTSQVWMN